MDQPRPQMTSSVNLPGGQDRLRQLILHVSEKCAPAKRFGLIKLNKIIWRADFTAFAARRVPVTGRAYKRQKFGPVAADMLPLHSEMLREGLITVKRVDCGNGKVEQRTLPVKPANLDRFDSDDLGFVQASIDYYWERTGEEASDDSHGVAWSTRSNGDAMPYELSFLSDDRPGLAQLIRLEERMASQGWTTE